MQRIRFNLLLFQIFCVSSIHCQDYFLFSNQFSCLACDGRSLQREDGGKGVFSSSNFTPSFFYALFYHQQQINSTPPIAALPHAVAFSFPMNSDSLLPPVWPFFHAKEREYPWRSCSQILPQLCRNFFNFTDKGYG